MVIELRPERPAFTENITEASSSEFAHLIRELGQKKDSTRIEGQFSIYRSKKGPVVIELDIAKEDK